MLVVSFWCQARTDFKITRIGIRLSNPLVDKHETIYVLELFIVYIIMCGGLAFDRYSVQGCFSIVCGTAKLRS